MSIPQEPPLQISISEHPLVGLLWAASTSQGLVFFSFGHSSDENLSLVSQTRGFNSKASIQPASENSASASAIRQVQEYLDGERQIFSLPIAWQLLTSFQVKVYRAVAAIPYAQTRTYAQIAALIGQPKATRAVGGANASNPLPIIIPCHRLVGADGSLRGYGGAGGLQTKRWLLEHEKHALGA